MVDHLRWDLKAIFDQAVGKGYLELNPAADLFTPKTARRAARSVLKREDVNTMLLVLDPRADYRRARVVPRLRADEISS